MISIIIVTYNSEKFIRECIKSIYRSIKKNDFEIIVVDNNSSDKTSSIVYREFPAVRLIRLKKNLGFAKANNIAFERSKGDIILLLNPDTIVTEKSIDRMAEYIKYDDSVGVIGAKLKNFDGTLQLSCRRFPNFFNVFFGRKSLFRYIFPSNPISKDFMLEDLDYDKVQDVDWIMGACLMTRRDIVSNLGFFDETFKLFVEDTDLCYRIKKSNRKVIYLPDAVIYHYHGASVGEGFTKSQVYHNIGMYNFFRKHFIKNPLVKILLYYAILIRLCCIFIFSLFIRFLKSINMV